MEGGAGEECEEEGCGGEAVVGGGGATGVRKE